MPDFQSDPRRVLVVEDEYMLAHDLRDDLEKTGMEVLGPVATVEQATALVTGTPRIDGAILDINLRGDLVFAVADLLVGRGIPFLFATGYDQIAIPPRFAQVQRCEKPIDTDKVVRAIDQLIGASRTASQAGS